MIRQFHPWYTSDENENTNLQRGMDPSVCSSAIYSTIAKTWKQPKCPSADEWIKKMCYTHTHPLMEKNWILTFATPWVDLVQCIMLSETSQRKTATIHDHLYVKSTYLPSTCMWNETYHILGHKTNLKGCKSDWKFIEESGNGMVRYTGITQPGEERAWW